MYSSAIFNFPHTLHPLQYNIRFLFYFKTLLIVWKYVNLNIYIDGLLFFSQCANCICFRSNQHGGLTTTTQLTAAPHPQQQPSALLCDNSNNNNNNNNNNNIEHDGDYKVEYCALYFVQSVVLYCLKMCLTLYFVQSVVLYCLKMCLTLYFVQSVVLYCLKMCQHYILCKAWCYIV